MGLKGPSPDRWGQVPAFPVSPAPNLLTSDCVNSGDQETDSQSQGHSFPRRQTFLSVDPLWAPSGPQALQTCGDREGLGSPRPGPAPGL